jgi:hypothetical protein
MLEVLVLEGDELRPRLFCTALHWISILVACKCPRLMCHRFSMRVRWNADLMVVALGVIWCGVPSFGFLRKF